MRQILLILVMLQVACSQISMTGGVTVQGGSTFGGSPQLVLVFGDSIATGAGSSNPILSNGYSGQMVAHYGWYQKNIGVGGASIGDWAQFQNTSGFTALANGVAVAIFGVAEVFGASFDGIPIDYTVWTKAAMANMLHNAITDAEHQRASTFTFSGTWTSSTVSGIPVYDLAGNRATVVAGSTAAVSVTGTTVYLIYLADQPSGDASFTVSIDGVSQGSFSTTGTHESTRLEGYRYFQSALRFPGLSVGSHSMVVTYSSGTTPLILQWAAGNTLANHPRFFVGNCLPEFQNTIPSDIATYNTNFATVATSLAADGLAVYQVNTHDAIDPHNSNLWNSSLHPNTAGYALLAAAFEAVIDTNP